MMQLKCSVLYSMSLNFKLSHTSLQWCIFLLYYCCGYNGLGAVMYLAQLNFIVFVPVIDCDTCQFITR